MERQRTSETRSAYARFLDIKAWFKRRGVREMLGNIGMGLAAFLLSRAGVTDGRYPFGVAFAAASGVGAGSVLPFLGAAAGYLSGGIGIGGIRYICALILIFVFGHALKDRKITRRLFYPAAVSALTLGAIGIAFVLAGEGSLSDTAMAVCEGLICGGSAYFYRFFIRKEQGDELFTAEGHNRYVLSGFVFMVTCLVALEPFEVIGVSLGRVAAVMLVLVCASSAGFVGGAIGGVLCGFAMDLAGAEVGCTMIYALSGMVAGVFAKKSRFLGSVAFVLVNAACSLWLREGVLLDMSLYEAFAASVIIMLIPQKAGQGLAAAFRLGEDGGIKSARIRDFLSTRLEMAAEAFDRVSDAMGDDALRIESLQAGDGEDMRRFNRDKKREAAARSAMREQYADTARIFRETSGRLMDGLRFDKRAEEALSGYLMTHGIEAGAAVFRDSDSRLHAEISGPDISDLAGDLAALRETLEDQTGAEFGPPRVECGNFGARIHLDEVENLAVTIGVAIKRKNGERISGDSGLWFKDAGGRLYVLLSDGMGSGQEAARESSSAVRIVESLIKAGIAPAQALRMLNSTLFSRSDNVCTTVDLLTIDMFSGSSVFYKYGAAPSYILADGRVGRVTGCGYPAGGRMEPPEETRFMLREGNLAVLASDGVGGSGRRRVSEFVSQYNGESAKDFAVGILKNLGAREPEDDMTVMVVKVDKRV